MSDQLYLEKLWQIGKQLFGRDNITSRRDIPLHRNEAIEPFFIVGSGRCGSTLLRRMLTADDQVYIPPETQAIQDVVRLYVGNRNLSWPYLVASTIGVFVAQNQFKKYFPDVDVGMVAEELWQLPEKKQSLAIIHDYLFREFARAGGSNATYWADKTPMYIFHLDLIVALFPKARFVHLLRDGVDVVSSRIKHLGDVSSEYASLRWLDAVNCFQRFSQQNGEQCIEIRYEDLVSSPEKTLQRLCSFLKLDFHQAMVVEIGHVGAMGDASFELHHKAVACPVSTVSIGKGRRSMTGKQLEECQAIIGMQLEELGYPPAC